MRTHRVSALHCQVEQGSSCPQTARQRGQRRQSQTALTRQVGEPGKGTWVNPRGAGQRAPVPAGAFTDASDGTGQDRTPLIAQRRD